ncbi:MAG: HAMP domain-containing histidine kinase, partial [Muribaculaceae bacterium]|nr:HAMP domain-containing histidine kinase [Muribaculaceae bacterium]
KENLENRLLNVNNTVIAAYEQGADLQETVNFIRLFTDNTTLDPLRITVYDNNRTMVADNNAARIMIYDNEGQLHPEVRALIDGDDLTKFPYDIVLDNGKRMVCSKKSADGMMYSFAALPYEGEVVTFLSINPGVWIVILLLGVAVSVLTFFGVRAVCRNVYTLRDFAEAVSSDNLPDNIDSWKFSKDELGDVSKHLLTLYSDKIQAEQEKTLHERRIGMSVSHELKTPVGIVKGYIDTVLDSDDMPPEMRRRFLVRAQQNVDRLTTLINDLSSLMRLDDGGRPIEISPVNFRKLVAQMADDIKQGETSGNMVFEYSVPDNCVVAAHESLLTNALLNLVRNSVKYSDGTRMSLRWIGEDNGFHRFTFSDNGVGVEKQHLDHLFDLFYRVDTGRARKNGGMGLGLPLVRQIIRAMGGKITVCNGSEGGLQFTFTLPVSSC